jgi:hypothetical protein
MSYFHRQYGIEVVQVMDQVILHCQSNQDDHLSIQTNKVGLMKKNPDFIKLRSFFGWKQPDVIKKTFENTTQNARLPTDTVLKQALKSPNHALNVV